MKMSRQIIDPILAREGRMYTSVSRITLRCLLWLTRRMTLIIRKARTPVAAAPILMLLPAILNNKPALVPITMMKSKIFHLDEK